MRYTTEYFKHKITGSADEWIDAIESLGVRAVFYNGSHKALLGHEKLPHKYKTNATVAFFDTKEECEKWCKYINAWLYED